MKTPVLNIDQFKPAELADEVYVNRFSDHLLKNKNLISKPHSHDFYLCVFFTRGNGIHEIDFNTYDINPGSVFFIKPGQTHFWKFDEKPQGYIFFHSKAFYEMYSLVHQLEIFPFYYPYHNVSQIHIDFKNEVQALFENVLDEYVNTRILRELKLLNGINAIYIQLTRMFTSTIDLTKYSKSGYFKILEQLEQAINTYFEKEKLPRFYADLLHITPRHLNRVVHETLDKTTTQLIADRVILEARRLIVHSERSLSEIAECLGFSDYAYFSRYFKSNTGLSPLAFQKRYKHISKHS